MTDLEWDQYVSKVAREMFVPQWGMFAKPANTLPFMKNVMPEIEHKKPQYDTVIVKTDNVSYINRYFKYKGKLYRKRFVDKYKEKTYTKRVERKE